jgi:hypothetical protein
MARDIITRRDPARTSRKVTRSSRSPRSVRCRSSLMTLAARRDPTLAPASAPGTPARPASTANGRGPPPGARWFALQKALTRSKGVWDIALRLPVILEEVYQLAALAKRLLRARDGEISPRE